MNIIEAMHEPKLFARWFRDRSTWSGWQSFLRALFALPMSPDEVATFQSCTARLDAPTAPAKEAWLICGRRAGKSFVLALVAVFLACFRSWQSHLAPGERATILVLAADRRQAHVILRYVRALLTETPMLRRMLEAERAESFDLVNQVTIEIGTASFRTVRGYTIAAALCDELAFWPSDDSISPDYEILDAIRPGLATLPGSMLLCASSPYARKGALWDAWKRHHGDKGDPSILVWQAPTRLMNPTVSQAVVDAAMERDSESASAEWLAQFRTDLSAYVDRGVVERCVDPDCVERPPERGIKYVAFVDPSGGSSDSMTLAVAHRDGESIVIDLVREMVPPFSPASCVREFAEALKPYGVKRVHGDRYAGEWPREAFRKQGIEYRPGALPKSELYQNLLPLLNTGAITLPDNRRMIAQLAGLERRVTRAGKDSIDHGSTSHDDLANCVAGVAWAAQTKNRQSYYTNAPTDPLFAPVAADNGIETPKRFPLKGGGFVTVERNPR